jgi:hypothetical protein
MEVSQNNLKLLFIPHRKYNEFTLERPIVNPVYRNNRYIFYHTTHRNSVGKITSMLLLKHVSRVVTAVLQAAA